MDSELSLLHLPGLCCKAFGGNSDDAIPVSAAWYLMQRASHLLDAIEDGDNLDNLLIKFNESQILNLSTGLIFTAESILNGLEINYGIKSKKAIDIRMAFSQQILKMIDGQHLDLSIHIPNLDEAWEIAKNKSGEFFSLVCYAGGRLGTNNKKNLESLTEYGNILGVIIQIADDLDGILNNQGGSDIVAGKWGLPAIYSYNSDFKSQELKSYMEEAAINTESFNKAREIIINSGAVIYLILEVQRYKYSAEKAIEYLQKENEMIELTTILNNVSQVCHEK
ncbi:MAG: polyprenyl synthetase family protein [Anaerolineaceae bacterium]|nr:polyprenyl synthetase family protein [Anaerolineaceae bacterium]